jgi:outer membrane lipoprotein-sorting protein
MARLPLASSRRIRWAVPVVAAVALAGVGPLAATLTASAQGSLPPRTAAQLLVDVQHAHLQALSGTVVETSALGLPSLPNVGGHGGSTASFSSLVAGSHTMRLWYAGPDQVRLALLGQLGESDLVRNGGNVWAWSSADNTATHWTAPTEGNAPQVTPDPSSAAMTTPQGAAEAVLKAIDPTTRVSIDSTAVVAGRSAYELDLIPRDPRSTVGSVRIAIDGSTHIPTRVQVYARGATSPAFEIGFTSFSTSAPPASTFAFTPPPGATVKQGSATAPSAPGLHAKPAGAAPRVVGSGWTSVVVAPVGSLAGSQGGSLAGILKSLPTVSGSWGSGHLLHGALFSAVLTDDGRLAVGAVPPSMLYAALGHG